MGYKTPRQFTEENKTRKVKRLIFSISNPILRFWLASVETIWALTATFRCISHMAAVVMVTCRIITVITVEKLQGHNSQTLILSTYGGTSHI